MIAFICLFFPALLTVGAFEALTKQKLTVRGWVYRFCFHVVAINFLVFLCKKVGLYTAHLALYTLNADMTPNSALNYLLISGAAAAILLVIELFTTKHVQVTLEEKTDETEEQ